MDKSWEKAKEEWRRDTSLSEELVTWITEFIEGRQLSDINLEKIKSLGIEESKITLKNLKQKVKLEITAKENSIDDLSLNAPNSYKLQVSVPSNLNYLMKAWAAAEGRDLSGVALQCLETGLRSLKSKGVIPTAAVKRYDTACEKRIALAEANKILAKHEQKVLNESN